MNDFYGAVSAACFALLGLWWVVIELNHRRWLTDPTLRRAAARVSLYFLLPGTVSLLAMLDSGTVFWRVVFLIGAVVGLIDAVLAARSRATIGGGVVLVAAFVVFSLVALVAAVPALVRDMGVHPLAVEGVLLSMLILLGAWLAWLGLISAVSEPQPGA